ncbi:MAG: hypothetical protein IKD72_01665 [Clostridia bacterium]|nr:hypothetical protein [Clostridia bacterium]
MDPKELKAAAEQLSLTEEEKQAMIAACAGKKRRVPMRGIAAIAAALLVLTALAAAPGIFLRAGRADKAAEIAEEKDYVLYGDESADQERADGTAQSAASAAAPAEATRRTEENGGGTMKQQRYRINYYDVPAPFADLVGRNEYGAWYDQYILPYEQDDPNEMVIKQFIQHFHVSREAFDKANLRWAILIRERFDAVPKLSPKDYWDQETEEIYNADIIFTFDDEIINSYYLSPKYPFENVLEYEDAVAAGEYTSQTEEWVDVDEMEAEILAKYGSLD